MTWFCFTLTSCSSSSRPFWFNLRAFASLLSCRVIEELLNARTDPVVNEKLGMVLGVHLMRIEPVAEDETVGERGLDSLANWQGTRRNAQLIMVAWTALKRSFLS